MPKIQIINEKSGQTKYSMILPKSVMDDLSVKKGDSLLLKKVSSEEITFKLKRKQ